MSSVHRPKSVTTLAALLVLLVLQVASVSAAGAGLTLSRSLSKDELPLNVVILGPIRALPTKKSIGQAPPPDAGDTIAADTVEPVVSARSILLNNNITISQSRLVLSRLDQLFLLKQLLDTIDLAPKTASLTGKMGGGDKQKEELETSGPFAEGFLFELTKATAGGDDDDDNVVAIVDVGGSKLGFGWRYPLAYWNQLDARSKPKCPFGRSVGSFYYC